jgi:hypothetical protein
VPVVPPLISRTAGSLKRAALRRLPPAVDEQQVREVVIAGLQA